MHSKFGPGPVASRAVWGTGFSPQQNFFFFLVGRNSAGFAPARSRKSFPGSELARGGGAKLTEFRPGGGTKLSSGGAKFVRHFEAGVSDVQNSPHLFLDI